MKGIANFAKGVAILALVAGGLAIVILPFVLTAGQPLAVRLWVGLVGVPLLAGAVGWTWDELIMKRLT